MRRRPQISFVLPSYNYGRYLRECIDSILFQDENYDFEIIVIDDASTDDSVSIIRSYSGKRIRAIFHSENQGHVVTINEGFANARGEYVARIDSDDRYRKYYLSEVLKKFDADPRVGLVYGDVALINEKGEITTQTSDRIHQGRDFKGNEFLALLEGNFIPAPTVIARRDVWEDALPIPDGLAFSDWYLTLHMARRHDFYYIHRPLADYRVHSKNLHVEISRDKSEEETIFRILKEIFRNDNWPDGKNRIQNRVYATQYLTLADKYFGFRMMEDARRCYLQALRMRPSYSLRPDVMRRLAATFTGRHFYEGVKDFVRERGGRRL